MEQYIKKSSVVAKIKGLLAFYLKEIENNKEDAWAIDTAKRDILQEILSFINTLEVQEVDSDKYEDGYEQGYADAIEKACELLARMIWQVTYEDLEGNSVQNNDKMVFIDEFKNYLKGGNNGK